MGIVAKAVGRSTELQTEQHSQDGENPYQGTQRGRACYLYT